MLSTGQPSFFRNTWFKEACLGALKSPLPLPAHLLSPGSLPPPVAAAGVLGSPWPRSCCPPASGRGPTPSVPGGGQGDSSVLPTQGSHHCQRQPRRAQTPGASDAAARALPPGMWVGWVRAFARPRTARVPPRTRGILLTRRSTKANRCRHHKLSD